MEKGARGLLPSGTLRGQGCVQQGRAMRGHWGDRVCGIWARACLGPAAKMRSSMSILGWLMGHRNLRREAAIGTGPREGAVPQSTKGETGRGALVPPHPEGRAPTRRLPRCCTPRPGGCLVGSSRPAVSRRLKRVIAQLPGTPTCNHKGLQGEGRSQGDGEQRQTDASKAQGCRPLALEDASKRPRASEDPALPAPGRQTLNTHSLRNQGFLTPRAITNEQTLSLATKLGICDSRNKKTSTRLCS